MAENGRRPDEAGQDGALAGQPGDDRLCIAVLGPLKICRNGAHIEVGPAMVRNLLVLLALHPERIVSRDEIIRALWEEDPPATCVNLVQVYVSRLRSQLRAGSGPDPASSGLIVRDRIGYRLDLGADHVDLARFDQLHRSGRELRDAGDIEAALSTYRSALQCWRGSVLEDLDPRFGQLPAATAAARRRADTAAEYADLCFDRGQHSDAAEQLRPVIASESLHEGLHSRLMLALSSTGDRSSALQMYEQVRRRLSEELGVDPGAELQAAHLRVLRDGDQTERDQEDPEPAQLPGASNPGKSRARTSGSGRPGRRLTAAALGATLMVATAGVIWTVSDHRAERDPTPPALAQPAYIPTGAWSWDDGPSLGDTPATDQWASAHVSGLIDADHNAGFWLRRGDADRGVLVAVSRTQWKIEPTHGHGTGGNFAGDTDGVLRVSISRANLVTITFDGKLVTQHLISGANDGRGIAPTGWQSHLGVRLTGIRTNARSG